MSTVRSVTLNDVPVSENQTHIVIYHEKREEPASVVSSSSFDSMKLQIDRLTAELERLNTKVEKLENSKSTPFFGAELSPAPAGLEVRRLSDTFAQMNDIKEVIINLPNGSASASGSVEDEADELAEKDDEAAAADNDDEEAEVEEAEVEVEADERADEEEEAQVEVEVEVDERADEKKVEEAELADKEAEVAEDEGEEDADELADEEEEEALELEEFEYKGVTYYKDSENQVYQKDSDGDLDDTPIGIWNTTKQKIQKYAAA